MKELNNTLTLYSLPGSLGLVGVRHDGHGGAVKADLEPGGAPLNKLDCSLGLDVLDGLVHILVNKSEVSIQSGQ